jgi:hypothetical protein
MYIKTNLCRKRSAHKKNNIAISGNMAYGEVHLKPGMMSIEGEYIYYENPDKILKPSDSAAGQLAESDYETIDIINKQ